MTENHKGHVTETPDVSYIKNVDVTHEVSDVYISGIAKFVVGLSILMIASFLLMWGMFDVFDARIREPQRSPMALNDKERLPPEPRIVSEINCTHPTVPQLCHQPVDANHFAAEAVCFLVQWMHRRDFFTEGNEGNKDLNLRLLKTFVIFASFC